MFYIGKAEKYLFIYYQVSWIAFLKPYENITNFSCFSEGTARHALKLPHHLTTLWTITENKTLHYFHMEFTGDSWILKIFLENFISQLHKIKKSKPYLFNFLRVKEESGVSFPKDTTFSIHACGVVSPPWWSRRPQPSSHNKVQQLDNNTVTKTSLESSGVHLRNFSSRTENLRITAPKGKKYSFILPASTHPPNHCSELWGNCPGKKS